METEEDKTGEARTGDKPANRPTRVRLGPEVPDTTPHLQMRAVTAISNMVTRLGFVWLH